MIRTRLDDITRAELNALRRSDLPAAARDRIEMVFLSDAGGVLRLLNGISPWYV